MIDAVVRQLSQLADANSLLLSRSGMIPLLSIAYVASRIPMIRHASRTDTPSFLHRHCRFRTILSIRVSTSLLFKKKKKGKKNRKKSWKCYYVTEKSIENNKGNDNNFLERESCHLGKLPREKNSTGVDKWDDIEDRNRRASESGGSLIAAN